MFDYAHLLEISFFGCWSYTLYLLCLCRTTPVIANGPSAVVAKGMKAHIGKSGGPTPHEHLDIVKENPRENSGTRKSYGQLASSSSKNLTAETQVTSLGAHFSSSDLVLVPSHDSRMPGAAGTIKREVQCQRNPVEQIPDGKELAG